MAGRIVLLVTSPRLPAGLLTGQAWRLLGTHTAVLAGAESELTAALRVSDITVRLVEPGAAAVLAEVVEHGTVVWIAGPGGDGGLARELGMRLAREPGLAELELMYGSWDPPGARLLDAVAVMDRLVSPGGDPWKHQQTHRSLAPYLLEEAYEAYDAIVAGDLDALREELGDVLLQIVLHARMAEDADRPWSVDDVAGGLAEKLIRRNPHVFGAERTADVDEITANWERIKKAEKDRGSMMDGIPLAQPALSLAAKILSRVERAGLDVPVPVAPSPAVATDEDGLGAALLALVASARARGLDAEAALRRAALSYADAVRARESAQQ